MRLNFFSGPLISNATRPPRATDGSHFWELGSFDGDTVPFVYIAKLWPLILTDKSFNLTAFLPLPSSFASGPSGTIPARCVTPLRLGRRALIAVTQYDAVATKQALAAQSSSNWKIISFLLSSAWPAPVPRWQLFLSLSLSFVQLEGTKLRMKACFCTFDN